MSDDHEKLRRSMMDFHSQNALGHRDESETDLENSDKAIERGDHDLAAYHAYRAGLNRIASIAHEAANISWNGDTPMKNSMSGYAKKLSDEARDPQKIPVDKNQAGEMEAKFASEHHENEANKQHDWGGWHIKKAKENRGHPLEQIHARFGISHLLGSFHHQMATIAHAINHPEAREFSKLADKYDDIHKKTLNDIKRETGLDFEKIRREEQKRKKR